MNKKTIIHIIYNLGRGGAETMLIATLKELNEYNNILVTLYSDNHFGDDLPCSKYICLDVKSLPLLPLYSFKLRKIIKDNNADMVHSHLFWPTFLSRLSVPKKIPLITTIHAFIASSVEYKRWYIRWLDKFSYRLRKNIIIAVAKGAQKDYFSFLNLQPYKAFTLYTFVDTRLFNETNAVIAEPCTDCRVLSVGALRIQKNHVYLVEAFKLLKNENIELHIYGEGPLQQTLQKSIDEYGVKIVLKGQVSNIHQLIGQYDVFTMSSTFEGFSLGVLEAMALQRPLLLSDIASFKEQCEDTAVYFSLNDPSDFADKLKQLIADKYMLTSLGQNAKQRALENFTLEHHMRGLRDIYTEALATNNP
jgi:glycosyltransferase involved in cell wall biosynthesis